MTAAAPSPAKRPHRRRRPSSTPSADTDADRAGLVEERLGLHDRIPGRRPGRCARARARRRGRGPRPAAPSAPAASGTNRAAAVQPEADRRPAPAGRPRRRAPSRWRRRPSTRATASVAVGDAAQQLVAAVGPARPARARRPPARRCRGRGSTVAARPISSRMTATSAKVAPAPPRASGTSRPSQPACGHLRPVGGTGRGPPPGRGGRAEQVTGHRPQLVVDLARTRRSSRRRRLPRAGRGPARR